MSNELGFSGIKGAGLSNSFEGSEGVTVITGKGIDMYGLLALRGALKMQVAGLKMSRGMSATQLGKRKYGLKGQAKTMLTAVEAEIARINKEAGV
jgi:hypothetical protein